MARRLWKQMRTILSCLCMSAGPSTSLKQPTEWILALKNVLCNKLSIDILWFLQSMRSLPTHIHGCSKIATTAPPSFTSAISYQDYVVIILCIQISNRHFSCTGQMLDRWQMFVFIFCGGIAGSGAHRKKVLKPFMSSGIPATGPSRNIVMELYESCMI